MLCQIKNIKKRAINIFLKSISPIFVHLVWTLFFFFFKCLFMWFSDVNSFKVFQWWNVSSRESIFFSQWFGAITRNLKKKRGRQCNIKCSQRSYILFLFTCIRSKNKLFISWDLALKSWWQPEYYQYLKSSWLRIILQFDQVQRL